MDKPGVHVLIPAAGRGTRFGGAVLKQYLPVCGRAVLAHTIGAFRFHPQISDITVVVSPDDQLFESAVGALSGAVQTVAGGDTRAQSVRNGLSALLEGHPADDWVLVHDAARPCLPRENLDDLLEQGLASTDGAILAIPVGDTLKREGSTGEIAMTVDRRGLWAAQTPQMFRLGDLATAIDAAHAAGREITDESSAMEFAGARPLLVMGSSANIKVTHPGDLAIAEAWLQQENPTP